MGRCVEVLFHTRNKKMISAKPASDDDGVATSSLASDDCGEAVCYVCLDGGDDDEAGQPLRRDCACRGTDAGFVHLSCLAAYICSIQE